MKVELNEKDVYTLIMILDSEIRDTRKNAKGIISMGNKESLCLANALNDRATMLESIKEKLQNVE
jgi:hypothetical protein